jgi:ATP-dependent Lon protease
VAQTDLHVDDPWPSDLHSMGTVARAVQVIELPDGTLRVLLEGMYRARLVNVPQREPYFVARVERVETEEKRSREMQAMMRNVVSQFEEATNLSRSIPPEALVSALNTDEPGRLADLVATYLALKLADKQDLLETLDSTRRLRKLDLLLAGELELLKLERDIHARVHDELEDSQREHYLREQLKAIQDELGDSYGMGDDLEEYRERILSSGMSPEASDKALRETDRLAQMPQASPEVSVIRTYLDWLLELPWTTATQDEIDITRAMGVLNEDHYGLKKVKERVIEFLAVRQLVRDVRGPILCFVGPPGVGKTSIGRSIARAMGREFIRVSLGGVHDEAEIRGHRRTYVGALPGRIIQALRRARSNNPVFMIDEIDKIGADFRGDPTSALLEVLDPEQNNSFRDHYLEVAFDLSQVMFVATGNFLASIPPALRDRMEVIEFSGYTEDEKLQIAQRFLVSKQRKEHGINGKQIRFTVGGLRHLITHYTYEAGVRNLEREVAALCRKVATRVAGGEKPAVKVTPEAIREMRGPEVFRHDRRLTQDRIGIATGLAYTPAGGDVIHIEVSIVPGKGELLLTGQLGEVMRESAQAALGYARLAGESWGLAEDYFGKHDIHVHVPSGAIPKEGPSAGIAICTALISGLRQLPVRSSVAMTGEITLHGRVLPIGGVREKVLGAHRAGISKVILPVDNERDLHDEDEIPAEVRQEMEFVFVETMDQVMAEALAE